MLGTEIFDFWNFENFRFRYEFSDFTISKKVKKMENEKEKRQNGKIGIVYFSILYFLIYDPRYTRNLSPE